MASTLPQQTRTAELEALVRQLRQELADKEQRIAQLTSRLAQLQDRQGGVEPSVPPPAAQEAPASSRADLLAQLDRLYQEK